MKNDNFQPERERATPADSPPSARSAAVHLAAEWIAGIGFLRLHAAAYATVGAALLLFDLILNPSNPWAIDLLRVWLILLGSHAAGLVAGWVTWRAVRPHRLVGLQRALTDADDEGAGPAVPSPAASPRPLPATGRFTPGRGAPVVEDEDDERGLSGALAAIGDAVADLGDLALAGGAVLRRGVERVVDWIQGDDAFDDDESAADTSTWSDRPAASGAPTRWTVSTGSGRGEAASVAGVRPPLPIVPISRPPRVVPSPVAGEPATDGAAARATRPAEPTPLTPRAAKRREVSG